MSSSRIQSLFEQLKRYHRDADKLDYHMPVWLPFLQVVLATIGSIGLVIEIGLLAGGNLDFTKNETVINETIINIDDTLVALAGFLVGLFVISLALALYVVYKWVDRRNKHFERAILFYTTAAELATELGLPRADALHSRVEEMKVRYERRSPIVWAILYSLVPFVSFYVLHFLTKDFREHSLTEKLIYTEFYDGFARVNMVPVYRPEEYPTVPDRNTILYFIISILTGIFVFYWVYVVTKDPNEHFRGHRLVEGELLRLFEEQIRRTTVEPA